MTEGGFKQESTPKSAFEAEFHALPLDEKFAKLFRLEVATITEAVNYAVNSPMKVVENVGDALSRFGDRIEAEFRKADCPPYQKPPAAEKPAGTPPPPKAPKGPRAPKA